ncbi:MAG TPA: carboxypeptidase-like regulatory domain-containing protein, partial [Pyrinomonadaceae bacterium]|nr:carboxypeptidase-like regulatory domain-containing protein [Pyrinomonadaceae bacterium]
MFFRRRTSNTTLVINLFAVVVLSLSAVAALPFAAVAAGQFRTQAPTTGSVSGTVSDPFGAVIVSADVVFKSRDARSETTTDAGGVYKAELPAGTYLMTVRANGFCPVRRELKVEPGGAPSFDVKLKVAAAAGFMRVEGGTDFRGSLADFGTSGPCGERPPVRIVNVSAQRSAVKRPAAKTPAAAKPSAKTAAKPSSGTTAAKSPAGVVNLSTQPGASVWVDDVRRGAADAEGKLQL